MIGEEAAEPFLVELGSGMNNRAKDESVPPGFARSATNVDFEDSKNIRRRSGYTLVYSGDCHSIWNRYFVEGGDLKYLESDNTATLIRTGVGDTPMSYTVIADGRVFYSNSIVTGSIVYGVDMEWGIQRPPHQPTLDIRASGDMFAGEYSVAITWLRDREESGTSIAALVDVPAGGGIRLTALPVPPSYVTSFNVYVSSVNGEDFYLFGNYPASFTEVFIGKTISTTPLMTQFGKPPQAFGIIEGHYGRIYGAIGSYLYFSNQKNYGLFAPRNYLKFPSEVTALISTPRTLYVGTKTKIFAVSNIDGDGPPNRLIVKDYGAVTMLNTEYDIDNEIGYFRSTKGDCAATSEGITELTAANIAMDEYGTVSMSLTEIDGIKKLLGVSRTIVTASALKAAN